MDLTKRRLWVLLPLLAALALWLRAHPLTAENIAARSPREMLPAAVFLLALYAAKGVTMILPLSALTAAGGLLFPFPAALAVNFCGTALTQAGPYFLGRRHRMGLTDLTARYPRLAALVGPAERRPGATVFLLRLGGAAPGDAVSWCLGAAGVPWTSYLSAGLLGSLPRLAAATALGGALWSVGSVRFWLSLAAGGGLTALSLLLWMFLRKKW